VIFEEQLLTPIVPGPRCGQRFVVDPNRDGRGNPMLLEPGEEESEPPKCDKCSRETFGEAFDADTLDTLERKLGLGEEDKETLQAINTLVENPDRIYMVVKVQDRVDELERRLEDRIEGIRNAVESKVENANTKVDNANTRVFIYSLITAVAMFVAGLLFGAFLTLVLGG
jgi:hypothetical protein